MAPNLHLTGHSAAIFTAKFSPDGSYLASAGFDKDIFLWDIYNQCANTLVLKGHNNAILELQWSTDCSKIYTASADKSVSVWDVAEGKRLKKLTGHTSFVNSCHSARRGPDLIVSGSDDCSTKIWDLRQKTWVQSFESKYQVTAVSFSDTAEHVYAGGVDNQVHVIDLRKKETDYDLLGHTDTISALALSPDGSYLLTNAMDQTIRCWDVRPFVQGNRCAKIFQGASHNFEKNLLKVAWSADGSMISCGSSDKYTYIWDTTSRKILHKLGGHQGTVIPTSLRHDMACQASSYVFRSMKPTSARLRISWSLAAVIRACT